jgi:tetratricopeptide (TPR) repeat protein
MWLRASPLLAILIMGCSPGGSPDGPLLITGESQYNQVVQQLEKETQPILERFYADEELSADEIEVVRKSLRQWKGLIAFAPGKFSNYFGAGQAHYVLKDHTQALLYLQDSIQRSPAELRGVERSMVAEAFHLAGRSSLYIGRFEQAEAAAREARKLEPKSAQYAFSLADSLVALKKEDDAKKVLKEALQLDPNHPGAQRLLRFIDQPRSEAGKSR